jgi:kumamolisin
MNQIPKGYKLLEGSQRPPMPKATILEPVQVNEPVMITFIVRSRHNDAERDGYNGIHKNFGHARKTVNHEEFESLYGARQAELDQVVDFARSHQLEIMSASLSRRSVVVSGTAEQINKALAVQLQYYGSPSIKKYRGFDGPVHLPSSLSGIVEAVIGLDNRPTSAQHFAADPINTVALTPQAVAARYNFPPGTGIGQTIGIYEMATTAVPSRGYTLADLTSTMNGFGGGLTVPTPRDVSIDGQSNSGISDNETMLDISVASTIANGASIAVYFTPNTGQHIIHALQTMIHPFAGFPVPTVISISYGWGTDLYEIVFSADDYTQMGKLFRDASTLGITVLASTGDFGANFKDPARAYTAYPASDQSVLACGGTTIGNFNTMTNTFEEYVWNDATGATGGGVSDRFAVPDYQTGAGIPVQMNTGKAGRGIPDVSGNASRNSGYNLVIGGVSIGAVGGTSAVAPLYAGLIAIINSDIIAAGALYPAGFLNPLLYQKANTICRDITGAPGPTNNAFGGAGYVAGNGWDACTGLGSIHGNALLKAIRPLECKIIYQKYDNCDPGPVAGTTAVFVAEVTGGTPPFTYGWLPQHAAMIPGESNNTSKFSVAVPAAGTAFSLQLTVTDLSGIQTITTISFVSLDPMIAGIEHGLCKFRQWGNEFKRPIYINPGDPYRLYPYSIAEILRLNELTTQISRLTESLLKKKLTMNTGKLPER